MTLTRVLKAHMENQGQNPEDAIIDQIGELLQQLSPEKQAALISKLQEMVAPSEEPMPAQTVSPEGGVTGKPAGY